MFKPYPQNKNYLVYDDGRIYSKYTNKFLATQLDKDGYYLTTIKLDGVSRRRRVHRLVAETFIPNPNNLETVNHKDENKQNNNASNLEWLSKIDNLNYGTGHKRAGLSKTGGKNGRSRKVNMYTKQGELINTFDSYASAAHYLGNYPLGIKGISRAICGEQKTAYGYLWRLCDNIETNV